MQRIVGFNRQVGSRSKRWIRLLGLRVFLLIVWLSWPVIGFAEGDFTAQPESSSMMSMVVRMGASLAIVMTVLIVASKLYLKFGPARTLRKSDQIRLLAQYPLGPKKSLALVQVSDEVVLLGIGTEQITFLSQISKKDRQPPQEDVATLLPRVDRRHGVGYQI